MSCSSTSRSAPGSEEYLDSEKYQLRHRDWQSAGRERRTLAPYLTRLNRVRREHSALQNLRSLRFHDVDNENLIAFSKQDAEDTVVVICSLDSHVAQLGTVRLDMPGLGMDWRDRFAVEDQITGAIYHWGSSTTSSSTPTTSRHTSSSCGGTPR
ncbi:MAG: hypothetical protein WKF47_17505, partial [Geodermatophilaceae bacterium]